MIITAGASVPVFFYWRWNLQYPKGLPFAGAMLYWDFQRFLRPTVPHPNLSQLGVPR